MKSEVLSWIACGGAVLVAGLGAFTPSLAGEAPQSWPPVHYSGLINDYTPSAAVVKNGPYEMRGRWSLDVDARHGTAKFSAVMNMETSDYGMSETVTNAQGVVVPLVNKDDPNTRGAHTHHIVMTDGVISPDWSTCPKFSPAVTGGFTITGPVLVTGNGGPPPFGNPSTLTICVLGGTNVVPGPFVTYSNFTMMFGAPANSHFGMFWIHGVVLGCTAPWEFESKDCMIQD